VLEVAPSGSREEITVALHRVRKLSASAARIEQYYDGIECHGYEPHAIFPFHPSSLDAIRSIAAPDLTIWRLARVSLDLLLEFADEGPSPRLHLIYPHDFARSPSIEKLVEGKLSPSGVAALKIARDEMGAESFCLGF